MRTKCPVCRGLGRVPRSFPVETAIAYCGPNGERVPHERCQNCFGAGWVGKPDASPIDPLDPFTEPTP